MADTLKKATDVVDGAKDTAQNTVGQASGAASGALGNVQKPRRSNNQDEDSPVRERRSGLPPRWKGRQSRMVPVHQSRIADRPYKEGKPPAVNIKIELDLEVEVEIYARVKGDVSIGLL